MEKKKGDNQVQSPLQVEELLRPRYKVIADYPRSYLRVGDIFEEDDRTKFMGKYPHLFKKLEWWEERKPEEMPRYVKHKSGEVFKPVHFINSWAYPNRKGCTFNGKYYSYSNCQPATEQEYKDYLKTQTHE